MGYALDDPAFSRGVTPFKNDGHLKAMQPNPFLLLDEFKLQMREFIDVFIVLRRFARLWPSGCMPILFDRSSLLGVAPHRVFSLSRFAVL